MRCCGSRGHGAAGETRQTKSSFLGDKLCSWYYARSYKRSPSLHFHNELEQLEVIQETTPNPQPAEEEKTEPAPSQEVASPEQYIKHPLQNRWALWFFKNDKSKTWQANLRLISKFDTVEDFWALYNHIQLSSNLMPGCDYSLFKDGIEPMWEDEKNKRGGRWLITLNKQQRRSDLDRFWLETLLCLIGESFDDYSDDVCGAVVNVRTKGDKIAIWTTECENRDAVTHIGRVYKERLGLPPKIVIGYQSHADTATKSGSTTKNRFVV
ncbi:eukaryotic translation initiation factor 4E isoform X1 [Parus major]|uniref:eukaryotic translation initiation factor 4E isoform X1 n=1 Tax=Parus major TaxID=9157 RepID=UPI001444755D|nr:eukaryotic translation initiation factor 4E isoform X1 [Parus major]